MYRVSTHLPTAEIKPSPYCPHFVLAFIQRRTEANARSNSASVIPLPLPATVILRFFLLTTTKIERAFASISLATNSITTAYKVLYSPARSMRTGPWGKWIGLWPSPEALLACVIPYLLPFPLLVFRGV